MKKTIKQATNHLIQLSIHQSKKSLDEWFEDVVQIMTKSRLTIIVSSVKVTHIPTRIVFRDAVWTTLALLRNEGVGFRGTWPKIAARKKIRTKNKSLLIQKEN